MNYEEKLNMQGGSPTRQEKVVFGSFYKKQCGTKWHNVLELNAELADNLLFCEGLRADQEFTSTFSDKRQLHYTLCEDSGGVYQLEIVENGLTSFAQYLDENPAVVAQLGFTGTVIQELFDVLSVLHEKGVYYGCLAPQNLYLRKNGNTPLLLCHGSSFEKMFRTSHPYVGYEDFLAPEVQAGEPLTAQSDIYSLGKFIEWLYQKGDMPIEIKQVVAKATSDKPENRYASIGYMSADLKRKKNLKWSVISIIAAFVAALLCVGLYFELFPEVADVEFVNPVAERQVDDISEVSFEDPATMDLDSLNPDTINEDGLSPEEKAQLDAYMKKAEDIFCRQYTKECERIMSKVYNQKSMSGSEKSFVAGSNAMRDELEQAQRELAGVAGISEDRAGRIAMEIYSRLAVEKQREMSQHKTMGGSSSSDE